MTAQLIVKKFGGTSIGTLQRIEAVAQQIIQAKKKKQQLVIVVSAMSGETDRLLNLAYHFSLQPEPRELAALVTTGEQVSMALLAIALQQQGFSAKSYSASQLAITTSQVYSKAHIININVDKILTGLAQDQIIIIAGFQGISIDGDMTTLGRGGSDTSAVALACALHATECQIYTDVDGIYTADPRLVPAAYRLDQIDADAMLELASLGSKVLQWRSVALAGKYQIPLRVLSSFKEGLGTLIHYNNEALESPRVVALTHLTGLARWVIKLPSFTVDALTTIARVFAEQNIRIEQLNQASFQQSLQINLWVSAEEQNRAEEVLAQLAELESWQYHTQTHLARITLVGLGLRAHTWVAAKFLAALESQQIYVEEFHYSELALSAMIPEQQLTTAAAILHAVFFE